MSASSSLSTTLEDPTVVSSTEDSDAAEAEASSGDPGDCALRFNGGALAASNGNVFWELAADFTLETWLHSDDWSQTRGNLVSAVNFEAAEGWMLYIDPSTRDVWFAYHDAVGQWRGINGGLSSTLADGWHHVAVMREATFASLTIDGSVVATGSIDGQIPATLSTAEVGGNWETGSKLDLHGVAVDDVHLAHTALYTSDFAPPSRVDTAPETVFLIRFDECSGALATPTLGELVASDEDMVLQLDGAMWVQGNRAG